MPDNHTQRCGCASCTTHRAAELIGAATDAVALGNGSIYADLVNDLAAPTGITRVHMVIVDDGVFRRRIEPALVGLVAVKPARSEGTPP